MAKKNPKSEIRPFRKIMKLIRTLTPNQVKEIVSSPETKRPPALPMPKVFKIKDPNEFFIKLHSSIDERVEASPDKSWDILNVSEKALMAVYELEGEVNNGGFEQYFFNSAGDHAVEAVPGFLRIGAIKMADIVRRALAVYPGDAPSSNREVRWEQTDKIENKAAPIWSALTSEFLAYPENPTYLAFAYCQKHRADFGI